MSTYSTRDFSLASYLHSIGIRVLSIQRADQNGCYEFVLDDAQSCVERSIDFLNSEAFAFDQSQRSLKKLLFAANAVSSGILSEYSTRELSRAAYIISKRLTRFRGFKRTHIDRREYLYFFDNKRVCEELSLAFTNSDAARFDASQRALKMLIGTL